MSNQVWCINHDIEPKVHYGWCGCLKGRDYKDPPHCGVQRYDKSIFANDKYGIQAGCYHRYAKSTESYMRRGGTEALILSEKNNMRNKDLIKTYPSGRKLFDWMEGKHGTVDFVDKDDCVRVKWDDGTTTTEPTKDGKIDGFIDIVFDAEPVHEEPEERYIVRRLTPLECCRLQGFPDWWCDGVAGSDSAQYKMWGNGMALPNIAYIMYGFAEELEREEMEMLGV